MGPLDAPVEELAAIEEGRAFVRPAGVRITRVSGPDAAGWLHDLVTTDVASLEPGQARRSLMLTPTGRIRADFMVGSDGAGFVLLQRAGQPRAIEDLLSIYVLSSDVELAGRSADNTLWTLVGGAARGRARDRGMSPSLVGQGRDYVTLSVEPDPPWASLDGSSELHEVGEAALEVWRIRRGEPRMGVDFDEGALPSEVGLDDTIDVTKGCFLGQESVAKIRNLGHPPSVLRHLRTQGSVSAGTPVLDADHEVGVVTSAAALASGGTVAIVRVAWPARESTVSSPQGVRFDLVHSPD
jgi:tRNA-modifying protein YgfZ